MSKRHGVIRSVFAVLAMACPISGSAQSLHVMGTVGYSAPVPSSVRGQMSAPGAIASATRGGPMLTMGVEHGTRVGWSIEAVYSRHSSSRLDFVGNSGTLAAELEETSGLMVSGFLPAADLWGRSLRVMGSIGVLRTRLKGHGIVGGDAVGPLTASNTGPAAGAGLELPIACEGHDLLLSARAGQLLGHERGGGYAGVGIGLRW